MGKEKTEFEEQFVSKTEKTKKLWEKRITENTTLSMESVQWMAQRIQYLWFARTIWCDSCHNQEGTVRQSVCQLQQ